MEGMRLLRNFLLLLLCLSPQAEACELLRRHDFVLDLTRKSLSLLQRAEQLVEHCGPLVSDELANVKLRVEQGPKRFERRLYLPLRQHFDQLTGETMSGGHVASEVLYPFSPLPAWVRSGAKVSVQLLDSQKILAAGVLP